MKGHDHSEGYVLIGDPLCEGSQSVRDIFRRIGFREIEVCHSASRLREHLEAKETGLVVSEVDLRDDDACEMVHSLRHGERLASIPSCRCWACPGKPPAKP